MLFILQDATSIKKRKLDSDRRNQFEEAIQSAKHHLEEMELLIDSDSKAEDLVQRHSVHKFLLDQVLKSGHVLVDELQNGKLNKTDT